MARLHLLSLLVIVLSISHSSSQGPPPPQLRPNAQAFLDAHNSARAKVGVPPLQWSAILESNTTLVFQNRSGHQSCSFAKLSGTAFGLNLIWTTGPLVSPQEAVTSWVASNKYYNFANNSCLVGQQCGGYTQVVWNKSLELGCAQGLCADSALTICIYNPPGKYWGRETLLKACWACDRLDQIPLQLNKFEVYETKMNVEDHHHHHPYDHIYM